MGGQSAAHMSIYAGRPARSGSALSDHDRVHKNEALRPRWGQIREGRQIIEWVRNYRRQETEAAGGGRRVMLRVITEPLHAIIQKLKLLTIEGNPYIFAGENRQGQITEKIGRAKV